MMGPAPLRVALADDHPVVRDGLAALLASVAGIDVVATVATGRDAVRVAVTQQPDVLVLDIQMPDLDGVAATREITRAAPDVAVLILTMFDDDASLYAALRAGARGYLLKGASQQEITHAIHAVAVGQAIFGPGIARRILDHLAGAPATAPPEPFPELTPREHEVLELLAEGLPTTHIAARLGLAPKTVTNHVCAILTKLHVGSRAEAVARARDAGLPGEARTGSDTSATGAQARR